MWLCVQYNVWILCQQCLELFGKKKCLHNCFVTINLSLFSEALLQEFLCKIILSCLALGCWNLNFGPYFNLIQLSPVRVAFLRPIAVQSANKVFDYSWWAQLEPWTPPQNTPTLKCLQFSCQIPVVPQISPFWRENKTFVENESGDSGVICFLPW